MASPMGKSPDPFFKPGGLTHMPFRRSMAGIAIMG
jgi:hypothetical protein